MQSPCPRSCAGFGRSGGVTEWGEPKTTCSITAQRIVPTENVSILIIMKNNRHVSSFVTKVIISEKKYQFDFVDRNHILSQYKSLNVDDPWLIHANERTGSRKFAHLTNPVLPAGMK